ncbi:hypothetical protein KAFR_0G01100 [Kazachstania africana CBS 2517]|uniref:BHLH domain-containing protein n=1 Tax=Kazachstania africana (strain ATCC 22294 / BCRC 22015 / CBS 2517 / CECT 1963 / NBRC 1671 / NRRL Y-8276) TaxID=1071382 RepID=H2AXP3_KAZAF|nr:hypothetical protein KAFR_0G01100 [Kazachstania africana CBS 2517]CCF59143.1 hypothetical protein KAFR_0G01100 [Kazachstania africana CBS 2517]
MNSNDAKDENQRLLEELLSAESSHMTTMGGHSNVLTNEFLAATEFAPFSSTTVKNEMESPYGHDIPANRHEKLSYMNEHGLSYGSAPQHQHSTNNSNNNNNTTTAGNGMASFLDDMFTNESFTNPPHNTKSISYDQINTEASSLLSQSFNEPLPPELLFHPNDTEISFDDISSSISSSLNSELLTPSMGSFMSPSNSVLRSGSLRGQNNTPKSRHLSVTNIESASAPKSSLSNEERLRRKRDFHNAVERRRRELIKQKIKELGSLVPPTLLCFNESGKQVKPNKGIILNKTVEYIQFLLNVMTVQDDKRSKLNEKIDELERGTSQHETFVKMESNFNDIPDGTRIIDTRTFARNDYAFDHFLHGQADDKLMFNNNDETPTSHTLEFDT